MSTVSIVLQVYGPPVIYHRVSFLLTSLFHHMGAGWVQYPIYLYTDNPDYFTARFGQQPHLHFVPITVQDIARWKGPRNFVHRMKIEVLRDCARRSEGHLFYLDTDIYALQDLRPLLQQIDAGHSLMDKEEYVIGQALLPLPRKVKRFVKGKTFAYGQGKTAQISWQHSMWNAGILGIARENLGLVDEALALTDVLYDAYQKPVMEQLAFSYLLQTRTQVIAAQPWLMHWWSIKDAFDPSLTQFAERYTTLEQMAAHYAEWPKMVHVEPQYRPWWQKLLGSKK